MTTATQDALSRAIEYLGAVEVAPGRYAYRDDATRRYYVVSESDVAYLAEWLAQEASGEQMPGGELVGPGQAYSLWCSSTDSAEMPSWWLPQQQFAWRNPTTGAVTPETSTSVRRGLIGNATCLQRGCHERITVDLNTGEEVAA